MRRVCDHRRAARRDRPPSRNFDRLRNGPDRRGGLFPLCHHRRHAPRKSKSASGASHLGPERSLHHSWRAFVPATSAAVGKRLPGSVIPTEVEEWSERDERHERLRRERVGRLTSSIDRENSKRCLDFARHDIKRVPNVLLRVEGKSFISFRTRFTPHYSASFTY